MARDVVKEGKLKAHKNPKVRFSCSDCGAVWDVKGSWTTNASLTNKKRCP